LREKDFTFTSIWNDKNEYKRKMKYNLQKKIKEKEERFTEKKLKESNI